MKSHADRAEALARQLAGRRGVPVGLAKATSNLFRERIGDGKHRLDVCGLDQVLEVDPAAGSLDAEGMAPYDRVADAALVCRVMPPVVPQLKSITVGGAVAGIGIESSSFRYGLVHETLLEIEVLAGDGRLIVCTPDNAHSDLFFGFPNSYGTLGYALRLKLRAIPAKPYVELTHLRFDEPSSFFRELEKRCGGDTDFVDGVVFGPGEQVLTVGRLCDEAPFTSDYRFEHVFWRSLRERDRDFLHTRDYLWRWDTDWFWCSKHLHAQTPWVRRLLGPDRLNSRFYARVMRWNNRLGLSRGLDRLQGLHGEPVIQDVGIPVGRAPEFLDFLLREIGILPVWICPFRVLDPARRFPLFPVLADTLYVNFGFWDVVRSREKHPPGHFNRRVEQEAARLGGIKSLYSESWFTEEEFGAAYDRKAWDALKAKYDPDGAFPGLYEKCVLRR